METMEVTITPEQARILTEAMSTLNALLNPRQPKGAPAVEEAPPAPPPAPVDETPVAETPVAETPVAKKTRAKKATSAQPVELQAQESLGPYGVYLPDEVKAMMNLPSGTGKVIRWIADITKGKRTLRSCTPDEMELLVAKCKEKQNEPTAKDVLSSIFDTPAKKVEKTLDKEETTAYNRSTEQPIADANVVSESKKPVNYLDMF